MPIFQHDCPKCHFLGQWDDTQNKYDLYVCCPDNSNSLLPQKGIKVKTIIARYGNNDGDYISGPILTSSRYWLPGLIAYHAAKVLGYDLSNIKLIVDHHH